MAKLLGSEVRVLAHFWCSGCQLQYLFIFRITSCSDVMGRIYCVMTLALTHVQACARVGAYARASALSLHYARIIAPAGLIKWRPVDPWPACRNHIRST